MAKKKKQATKKASKKVTAKSNKVKSTKKAKAPKKATKKAVGKKSAMKSRKKMAKAPAKKATKKTATKKTAAPKAAPRTATTAKMSSEAPKMTKALPPVPKPSVALGEPVPAFDIPATGGQNINLAQYKGKKVVLYFYPKDMTPGCTLQGRDFTQLKDQFEQNGAVVFGVSRDSVDSHEKFRSKEGYTIDLLSDSDERLCHAFGVIKEKNMYGKKVLGVERSTFVIDQEGKLVKEWRSVSVPEHANQVLEYIKNG